MNGAEETDRGDAIRELVRGRIEIIGPVTARTFEQYFQLRDTEIEAALLALETEGFVLRGKFNPGATDTEWCDRRLLARIHRLTINRLRAEIEPVSMAEFLRFLLVWQRVDPEHRAEGPEGLNAVLEFLDGYELAAGAWEPEILALRVKNYSPQWLDQLCFTGRFGWGRLTPPQTQNGRPFSPLRSSPIGLFAREHLHHWLSLNSALGRLAAGPRNVSPDTGRVLDALQRSGAMFFSELTKLRGLLPSRIEQALAELSAQGWVTSDSFEGLRALLLPPEKRLPFSDATHRRRHKAITSVEFAGRWSLLRGNNGAEHDSFVAVEFSNRVSEAVPANTPLRANRVAGRMQSLPKGQNPDEHEAAIETFARVLLRRYGVVFRRLLERESLPVNWYELGRVYRRLEARGEIRGGYFVGGVSGEQFALPEAIGLLRSTRKQPPTGQLLTISAADPMNLAGIVTPGRRVAAIASNRLLLRDGVPIASLEAGQIVNLEPQPSEPERVIEPALRIGTMPAALRPYYS